jgi:hypothetical protein
VRRFNVFIHPNAAGARLYHTGVERSVATGLELTKRWYLSMALAISFSIHGIRRYCALRSCVFGGHRHGVKCLRNVRKRLKLSSATSAFDEFKLLQGFATVLSSILMDGESGTNPVYVVVLPSQLETS